jgi:hypothetical protein
MKRSPIDLEAVADWHNLAATFRRAALGKRARPEVQRFAANLEAELARLRCDIVTDTVQVGHTRRFRIRDPKPRIIHAPCFRERVLRYALMAHVGPVLDRALVDDTFACRTGKGALAAVQRAQHHARRWPWWAKIDIRSYFASVDHAVLKDLLARKLKDPRLLALTVKEPAILGRSRRGLSFCGYGILPGRLLLSRRRRRRYADCRKQWEDAYQEGQIDERALQAGYAGALAITGHADAAIWCHEQLRRAPVAGALSWL